MLEFIARLFRREAPLAVAPARRIKTYSADSGYVYQYVFDGFRLGRAGYEYAFSATGDRKTWLPVAVLLDFATVDGWAGRRGRDLSASERFGIAKIALRRAFDASEGPRELARELRIDADELEAITAFLDIS